MEIDNHSTNSGLPSTNSNNPWTQLDLSSTGVIVAHCDKKEIDRYESVPNHKGILKPFLLPEPYIGSPDAKIYLLNGNPGYHHEDYLFIKNKDYVADILKNLVHKYVPNQNQEKFIYYNEYKCEDLGGELIPHPGNVWWNSKTKKLIDAIKRFPDFFNIEYFPYHSGNLTKIPTKPVFLPSYNYTNDLINKAINTGKLIIILRMEAAWKKRIPNLANYPNVITLNSPQNVCITSKNVANPTVWLNIVNNA